MAAKERRPSDALRQRLAWAPCTPRTLASKLEMRDKAVEARVQQHTDAVIARAAQNKELAEKAVARKKDRIAAVAKRLHEREARSRTRVAAVQAACQASRLAARKRRDRLITSARDYRAAQELMTVLVSEEEARLHLDAVRPQPIAVPADMSSVEENAYLAAHLIYTPRHAEEQEEGGQFALSDSDSSAASASPQAAHTPAPLPAGGGLPAGAFSPIGLARSKLRHVLSSHIASETLSRAINLGQCEEEVPGARARAKDVASEGGDGGGAAAAASGARSTKARETGNNNALRLKALREGAAKASARAAKKLPKVAFAGRGGGGGKAVVIPLVVEELISEQYDALYGC